MAVRPGYKQTEVGIIPENWEVKFLKDTVQRVVDNRGKTPPLTSKQDRELIETASISFVNETPDYSKISKYVTEITFNNWFRAHPKKDDILISTVGEYSGASAILSESRGTIAQNLIALTIHGAVPKFIFHWTRSSLYKDFLNQVMMNQAQPSLRVPWLLNFKLPYPPVSEQRAITAALSDVDALLDGLERLIAKKRDLKQAAMKQLLTGQTRLPGFSEEWEGKRLDELADIRSGGTPSTAVPQFWDGNISWCTPTDITALGGRKYLCNTNRMITLHGLKSSSAEMIPARSIVMTSRATIGECAINTIPVSTNQGFKNFVPFETADVEFLYYLLTTQKSGFINLCGGSTFLEIGKGQLAVYRVRIPRMKAEQTAIATILSDMDAEIAALEARRDKTRALKQGMMQELLTGKTRLI